MASNLIAVLSAAGLLSTGMVAASQTRSSAVLPAVSTVMGDGQGGGGQKCRVDVLRSGAANTASVTRQVVDGGGGCVCTITTGPAGGANGAAESVVEALLQSRECEGAPASGDVGQAASGAAAGGGAGGGGSGALVGVLVAAGVAGGVSAGLGGDSNG